MVEGREYNGVEIIIEQPGGRRVTALAHISPIYSQDGNVLGACNVLIDITGRKHSDACNSEFLSSVGHEMRNPLGAVQNAVHILRSKGAIGSQSTWALQLIERQMQELVGLAEMLSDVAKLSPDSFELSLSTFDLEEAVRAGAGAQAEALGEKQQTLHFHLPSTNQPVCADRRLLERAVGLMVRHMSTVLRTGRTVHLRTEFVREAYSIEAGDEISAESNAADKVDRSGVEAKDSREVNGPTCVAPRHCRCTSGIGDSLAWGFHSALLLSQGDRPR